MCHVAYFAPFSSPDDGIDAAAATGGGHTIRCAVSYGVKIRVLGCGCRITISEVT